MNHANVWHNNGTLSQCKSSSKSRSAVCWAFVAGAVFANAAGSDQPVADSVITTKVKAELVRDRDTKARHVDVDTQNGVVTLSGAVESTVEKQKAEQDARNVKGVADVTNSLSVKQQHKP